MRTDFIVALAAVLPVAAQAAERRAVTADYEYRYGWPDAAARYPGLQAWLMADAARSRAAVMRDAAAGRREAVKGGFPFNRYEATTVWKTVTDTPRFLSLSGDVYGFTGGAHGNPASLALVWDKAARQRLEPKALFVSSAALAAAVQRPFCARLDQIRRQRRGGPPPPGDMFGGCPKLSELTLLLGSTNGRSIDRLGLIADPYVAGPFAEGKYEVTLPVTAAVLAVVKPGYRTAFRALSSSARA